MLFQKKSCFFKRNVVQEIDAYVEVMHEVLTVHFPCFLLPRFRFQDGGGCGSDEIITVIFILNICLFGSKRLLAEKNVDRGGNIFT